MTVTFTCSACQAEFASANELIEHSKTVHGVEVD